MEGKDNRYKDKRHKMKQMKQQYHRKSGHHSTPPSSSSAQEAVSGMVDIVDSSDERYTGRKGWNSSVRPQSKPRDMLLDDTDFDDDLNSVANAQMRAGDFKLMAQLPPSIGGHFKFASEKDWDLADNEDLLINSDASEYFTLNLKLLNTGIKTVPFYKRMDFPSSMFTKEQIAVMDKDAEKAEKEYQQILQEHLANPKPKIKIHSASHQSDSAKSQGSAKTIKDTPIKAPDELDELLDVTTEQIAKIGLNSETENVPNTPSIPPSTANSVVGNKNDIQEWLDNVLDE